MSAPAIQVSDLGKVYTGAFGRNPVEALRGLSLRVEPGEIFGLLGPNGAGKTTLVKILLSIVRPTTGEARLFGRPVTDPAVRRRIGYLPENHRFPDYLTARQMLSLYGRMAGVSAATLKTRTITLLKRVNMEKWADTPLRKYSKGMMQRVGLAQALVNDPDLVFLDEPTDGVDPVGRREVRALLLELRDQGKTIFLNSHLLSEVEQVCTRVAILDQGAVKREGRLEDLTSGQGRYELRSSSLPRDLLDAHPDQIIFEANLPGNLSQYRLSVPERAVLNALIDTLRSAEVEIVSLRPVQATLEEVFIQAVIP